jgi:hypothetical protein
VLYAGQSRAGANRTHGVYGMRTAYKPYGTFSTISYFYGQPYGIVITAVCTVRFILLATLVKSGRYIYSTDEKRCRIACPAGEEVVVPIGITEMYIGIPETCLSLLLRAFVQTAGQSFP